MNFSWRTFQTHLTVHDVCYTRDQQIIPDTKHTTTWSIDLHTNRKLLSFIILSLDYVFTWVSLYPLGILNCTITPLICYISSRDVVYPISLSLSLSFSLYFCSSDFCYFLCLSLYTIHNISNAMCNDRFKTDAIEMCREKKKKKKNEPCCRQI